VAVWTGIEGECFGWIGCAVRLLEKQQEQFLQDLQSLENEVDIANHRTKLEMLKKKMEELEKDADAAAPVRFIAPFICLQ